MKKRSHVKMQMPMMIGMLPARPHVYQVQKYNEQRVVLAKAVPRDGLLRAIAGHLHMHSNWGYNMYEMYAGHKLAGRPRTLL